MELKNLVNPHFKLTNLQLFSDGGEGEGLDTPRPTPEEPSVPKKDFDKVASELARIKRDQKEKMTLDQQKELELKERDAKIAELEKEITKSTLKSGLSTSGLDLKHVESITHAILEGDTDNIIKSLNKALEEIDSKHKQELESVKLELTPRPASGANGDGREKEITKEDFDKMSYLEKVELKEKKPELYKNFMI